MSQEPTRESPTAHGELNLDELRKHLFLRDPRATEDAYLRKQQLIGVKETKGFKGLIVWQRAVEMTVATYLLTSGFPKHELYGLTSQMRRAAVSVASNIAEGYGRATTGELKQFLGNARGSNSELETQLTIARELGLGSPDALEKVERLVADVSRLLRGYMNAVGRGKS
ncbi:MAG TPA: four helix bundle protein [Acidobacteriaceae bacterium]|jgi:four helix bundle protein|nr:four helix bundle protein [Acidobacteriaceae bacterium]